MNPFSFEELPRLSGAYRQYRVRFTSDRLGTILLGTVSRGSAGWWARDRHGELVGKGSSPTRRDAAERLRSRMEVR